MIYNINLFKFDVLSVFISIFILFFSLLIFIYSLGSMGKRKGLSRYYTFILLTTLASLGTVFANNLIVFMVFWGVLGLLLYLLIGFGTKANTTNTAKKTFIIVGGADALMLLGLALVWKITGTLQMDRISIGLNTKTAILAYLCLAAGAFAKAGAMPFHSWVPDTAEDAPTPITAFLPASLDKLLGIYFLMRISLDMFRMNLAMNTLLMAVGSFTIVAAVMMALIQHDFKRLLGYHAVSQVGYMVLGIGTGNLIGIAGGLFHMLNHAIYKSCLFLAGGLVEKKARTTDLDKLGGFIKVMPITFTSFLVASLAISGVPPFNGFASKWMVYQGIIEFGKDGGCLWIVWLVAAMFGSALTLASFMKLIHAIFLGQPSLENMDKKKKLPEANPAMWMPTVVLASLCIIFGVFAYKVPLNIFILPSLGVKLEYIGIWGPTLATILLLVGILVGVIIYTLGTTSKLRRVQPFVGGEVLEEHPQMRVSGAEFYNTIKNMGMLRPIYNLALKKAFDIYDLGIKITFIFNRILRYIHNGILASYLSWCLLGMGIMFYFLLLK